MKKGDFLWLGIFIGILSLFIIPVSKEVIMEQSAIHPYISGFLTFAILASMGDLLGKRIATGTYILEAGFLLRTLVWGVIGWMVTLVFTVFMSGAAAAQEAGLLPFPKQIIAQAIFGSSIMNLTFAPMMNTFHRVMDEFIEMKYKETEKGKISFRRVLGEIDWVTFVTFNWLKVGIFFWIPVHSIVFLLPEEIRVIVAAFSSIALGVILSFAAKNTKVQKEFVE